VVEAELAKPALAVLVAGGCDADDGEPGGGQPLQRVAVEPAGGGGDHGGLGLAGGGHGEHGRTRTAGRPPATDRSSRVAACSAAPSDANRVTVMPCPSTSRKGPATISSPRSSKSATKA
jgi:hypothetical protein